MSGALKLSVLITGDASSLRSEAGGAKVAIEGVGDAAGTATLDVAKVEAALEGAASAARETASTLTTVAAAEKDVAAGAAEVARAGAGAVTAIGGIGQAAVGSGAQLDALTARLQAAFSMSERVSAAAANSNSRLQGIVNKATGISSGTGMRDRAADIAAYGETLDAVREKYVPLFAAERQHLATIAEINAARAQGALLDDEATAAIERQTLAYNRQVGEIGRVSKGTGFAAHELSNLRSQAVDIGTMWSMGASPFQIISSQAGQIYEVLAGSKGGVTGALKTMGSMLMSVVTPTTMVVAGLTAAAFAVRYFGDSTEANMKKAEAAAQSYESTIKRLRTSQGELGTVMGRIVGRETVGSAEQVRRELALLVREQQAARKALAENLTTAGTPGMLEGLNPFRSGRDLYRTLSGNFGANDLAVMGAEVEKGTRSAENLRDTLQEIALDPKLPSDLKEIVTTMLAGAQQAVDVEARIKAITTAIREQKREVANDNYRRASDAFSEFLPDGRTQRDQIEEAYRQRVAAIRELQDNPRAMEGRLNTATAQRVAALKEVGRQEEVLRQGRELDIAAIGAQTVAERALLAAKRERLALSEPGANRQEIERRAIAASTMVYAEAEQSAADAVRQSQAARDQAGLVGYAAQVAAINAQYAEQIRLAGGSATAIAALTQARGLDLQALEATTRQSLFGAQDEQLRMLREEAGLIGMNDAARRVALAGLQAESELRRQGITVNGEWGRSYVENARQIAQMEEAIDAQSEAFEEMHDAGREAFAGIFDAIGSGKGVVEGLISTFARLSERLSGSFAEQLYDGLLGNRRASGTRSPADIAVGAGAAIAGAISPSGSGLSIEQTYAAPVGAVQRAALPPIVTGEGFSTSKAAQVASQSVPARVWNFFASKGLAAHQIAGIMGNAKAESAFNPSAVGDAGMAFGLFQWNDRGPAMKNFVGSNWRGNVDGQLEFAWKELQTSESRAYRALLNAKDVVQATEAFLGFERPHGYNTGVRNSHNYSGRVSFAQDAYRQFGSGGGEQVASSTNDTRAVARSVSDGVVDANHRMATGSDPWSGLRSPTVAPTAAPQQSERVYERDGIKFDRNTDRPTGWNGFTKAGSLLGIEYPSFSAAGGLSAGLQGFSSGYSSGSWAGGGLQGAMSGFMAGGPPGAIIGALAGIAGGIFGGKSKREAAHQEAAAKWEQMRPAYEAFDQSFNGEKGNFRKEITDQWSQLSAFMATGGAAWKRGTGNSSAQFASTGTKMFEQWNQKLRDFAANDVEPMISDLAAGEGLQGAFARGRAATKDLKKNIQATRDDIDIAFGNTADIPFLNTPESAAQAERTAEVRASVIERYNKAAGENALAMLFQTKTMSEVRKTTDGLRGTAAGLHDTFKDLGFSAEEANEKIQDRLGRGLSQVTQSLNEGMRDQIEALSGKGYFAEVRSFLKEFETLKGDVADNAADASRLPEIFRLRLQEIVDGAGVSGDELAELVRLFPELAGVVKDATSTITRTADQLKDVRRGYEDRIFAASNPSALAAFERQAQREREEEAKAGGGAMAELERALAAERANIVRDSAQQMASSRFETAVAARAEAEATLRQEYERTTAYAGNLRDFLKGMRTDSNLSTLNAEERARETLRTFRETRDKALADDTEAQDKLAQVGQEALEANRAFHKTSEGYGAVYKEIEAGITKAASTAEMELDTARRQVSFLGEIANGQKGLTATVTDYLKAVKEVMTAMAGVNANRNWGTNESLNRQLVDALSKQGLNYTGNFGSGGFQSWLSGLPAADRAKAEGIVNGVAGTSATVTPTRDWGVNSAANQGYVKSLAGIGLTYSGNFGSGGFQSYLSGLSAADRERARGVLGFATGGLIRGPGTGTSDSIDIRASNGEFMLREAATRSIGVRTADFINRTGELPGPRVVVMPMPGAGVSAAPIAANMPAAELREIVRTLEHIAGVLQGGFGDSIAATRDLASGMNDAGAAGRRGRAQSVDQRRVA